VFIGQPAANDESIGTVWEVNTQGSQTTFSNGQVESIGGMALYPRISPASRSASTTSLTTSSPSSVPSGQEIDLSATPSSPGLVQFENDGQPLGAPVQTVSGVANLQTTLFDGNDQVTAVYLGDATSTPSLSNTLDFIVGTLGSTTQISAPDGTTVPGDKDATLDVTVSGGGPTPTGTVTIYKGSKALDKNVPLTSGVATASFALTPGTSNVDAVYSGDSIYNASTSAKITLTTTTPYAPTITAVAKHTTKKTVTTVTISVTVKGNKLAGAPTGTVSANDGFTCGSSTSTATTLTAKCTETFTSSSEDETVTLTYSGGGNYVGATTKVVVQFGT
jgi:hypothetical protein